MLLHALRMQMLIYASWRSVYITRICIYGYTYHMMRTYRVCAGTSIHLAAADARPRWHVAMAWSARAQCV